MLVGGSGSRKSTAIKMMRNLLKETGYDTIAAEQTSKEKFLLDLQEGSFGDESTDAEGTISSGNTLWKDDSEVRECLIAADEFNDFVRTGNIDFLSMLGSLWDFEGLYKARVKNSKSVAIPSPTINMLAGNTPDRLATGIPIDAIGQGFTSRLLLVYGERSDKKIAFPPAPSDAAKQKILDKLSQIKNFCRGTATIEPDAEVLLAQLYALWEPLQDSRFAHYSNRRFGHLLKLCIIFAAARLSTSVSKRDVIYCNTVLTLTESFMPRAFGEFGKARNSATINKVLDYIYSSDEKPRTVLEIFKAVSSDLEKMTDLPMILEHLTKSGKIQRVGDSGWLPKREIPVTEQKSNYLDWSLISPEELGNG